MGAGTEKKDSLPAIWPDNIRGHSADQAHSLGQPKRPSSARVERDRQCSSGRASSSKWSEEAALLGFSRGSEGHSQVAQGQSSDGSVGLMPIVQRSAIAASSSKVRLGGSNAELQESAVVKPFKRRIGSNKSSPSSTHQPRLQQLMTELESDSPKGLDRALTPSMLKAVRKAASPASATTSGRPSSRGTLFHSSFSKRTSSDTHTSYENLAASFTEGLPSPLTKAAPAASPAVSARVLSSFRMVGVSPSALPRNASDSDLKNSPRERQDFPTMPASQFASEEAARASSRPSSAGDGGRAEIQALQSPEDEGSTAPAGPVAEDRVDQLLGSKTLSIATSRVLGREASIDESYSIRAEAGGPRKFAKQVRCNITRISQRTLLGLSKPAVFELYNMKGRMKLCAERDSGRQNSFSIFAPADEQQKRRVEASLVASTFAENQFLLIGTDPASPAAACDPDQDPVILAVAFGKSPAGLRTVTALLPDHKPTSAGSNDLGSKQHISAYFSRAAGGETIKNVKVLESIPGKELRGARFARGSVKNVQMQVAGFGAEWPGASPTVSNAASIRASFPAHKRQLKEAQAGRVVFEFGRLRHDHEFVCDYESPTLSAVQALGLAVACSAPKRAFLYL